MVMAKLIVNPNECAHQSNSVHIKKGESMVPMCTHTRNYGIPCTNSRTFPIGCPLQDGVAVPRSIDELNIMAQEEIKRLQSRKIPRTVKPGSLRRDRKNCIHFTNGHRCNEDRSIFSNFPDCLGVTCGCYAEVKTGGLLRTNPKTS